MILDAATSLGSGAGASVLREDPPAGWGGSLGEEFKPAKWTYVAATQIPQQPGEVMVETWVREALIALNPEIAAQPDRADEVIYALRAILLAVGGDGLARANENFTQWLRGEKTMPFGPNGEHVPVRLLDFAQPGRNRLTVTNQWTFQSGTVEKRFDVVFLINGLPLVIGEAKTPTRSAVTWFDGAYQVNEIYEKEVPAMFVPNVFSFATEGRCLRYGSIRMPIDLWGPWRDDDNQEEGNLALVRKTVESLIRPSVVLDILQNFTLFATDKKHRRIKVICRYQQYETTNKIVARVVAGYPKKGLIWHFQGSGKSLLMVFAAQKLRLHPRLGNPTVLIVVDRIDLDTQITATFNAADVPNMVGVGDRKELQRLLGQDVRKVLITTIHKFAEADGKLNDARDVALATTNAAQLCDEVDAMEVGPEGSPLLLAERRTLSFADRKIVIGSTPVHEETSHVLRSYRQSDARVFEVPCPECGAFHEIMWSDIQWPEGRPEEASYACPECGVLIDERHKPEMVSGGRWRATRPHVDGHAGFRLNALVSPLANASWGKLAAEFLASKDDPSNLQTFVNTILGQGWREDGDELDDTDLAGRAEGFSLDAIPEDVLAMTAGVDVQRDRLEISLIGWSRDGDAFVLGHNVVWGLPDDDATWAELDAVLQMRFAHPLGGKIGLDATAIDSSDGETMEDVYRFCFPRASRKVLAIKGVEGNRPWIERSKQKIRGGALWIVGVDGIKSHLTSRLSRTRSIRFSESLPPVWFEQLASERVVIRYSRGQPRRRFERIPGRRAEALDCTVYAFAARQIVNVNWEQRADDLRSGLDGRIPKTQAVVKSRWIR